MTIVLNEEKKTWHVYCSFIPIHARYNSIECVVSVSYRIYSPRHSAERLQLRQFFSDRHIVWHFMCEIICDQIWHEMPFASTATLVTGSVTIHSRLK